MTTPIDENLCVFCAAGNNCMAQSSQACWCLRITIPRELLDLIPDAKKRKACICLTCIKAFKRDSQLFKSKLTV